MGFAMANLLPEGIYGSVSTRLAGSSKCNRPCGGILSVSSKFQPLLRAVVKTVLEMVLLTAPSMLRWQFDIFSSTLANLKYCSAILFVRGTSGFLTKRRWASRRSSRVSANYDPSAASSFPVCLLRAGVPVIRGTGNLPCQSGYMCRRCLQWQQGTRAFPRPGCDL